MAGDGGEERKFRDSPPVGHEELEEVAENGLWQRWNESERESSWIERGMEGWRILDHVLKAQQELKCHSVYAVCARVFTSLCASVRMIFCVCVCVRARLRPWDRREDPSLGLCPRGGDETMHVTIPWKSADSVGGGNYSTQPSYPSSTRHPPCEAFYGSFGKSAVYLQNIEWSFTGSFCCCIELPFMHMCHC